MPTTRPRVPGWHPDPEDSSSLRHWDGKRWGKDRRPRPSWAPLPTTTALVPTSPADPGAGGPEPPRGSRRRWYLAAGAALVLGLLVISVPAWLGSGPKLPPQTVHDPEFIRQAGVVCDKTLPALKENRPEPREDTGTADNFGDRIDKVADDLAAVAADLRKVPVATPVEQAQVDGWLDDWDAYIELGHRYADAVRAENQDLQDKVGAESQATSKQIFVFAKANELDRCTF